MFALGAAARAAPGAVSGGRYPGGGMTRNWASAVTTSMKPMPKVSIVR